MGKQINVGLKFTADTGQAKASIQELQSLLNKLSLDSASTNKAAPEAKRLYEAAEAAKELSYHLNNAYNAKTGRFDLSALDKSLKSSNTSVQELSTKLIGAGDTGQQAFLKLAQSISQADQPMLKISSRMQDFAKVLKQTAKYQLSNNMIRGFTGAIQSAYHYAQSLNTSLTDIRIVTGYNTDQMAKFAEQANKAAKALSTTTTDYTKGSLIYFQQGLSNDEVRERTETTIKMANATGESTSKIADQMTAVWNNFADGSRELSYYADVMTALGAATASSTDEISEGINKFAATSKTVGLSYEYATAALATVTARTRESADVVGNAFKTLFARIQGLNQGDTLDDGTTLNKYSAALDKVGINIKTTSGDLKGMDQILDELGPKWQTLANDQKMALAQTVAGVRQYSQFMALMNNYDYFKENVQVARDSTGTLEKQADIYAESWEAAQKRVRAAAEGVYQDLIDDKFFISLNNGLADIISGLDDFIDKAGGLKTIIMALSGVILANFSNKIPEAINKAKYNFDVLTKGSDKAYQRILTQMNSVTEDQFKKYDTYQDAKSKGKDTSELEKGINRDSAFGVEIKQANQLTALRLRYASVEDKLNESEKQRYQIELNVIEAQQKQVLALTQQTETLRQNIELKKQALLDTNVDKIALGKFNEQSSIDQLENLNSHNKDGQYNALISDTDKFINFLENANGSIAEQYKLMNKTMVEALNDPNINTKSFKLFTDNTTSDLLDQVAGMSKSLENLKGTKQAGVAIDTIKNNLKSLSSAIPQTIQQVTGLDKAFRQVNIAMASGDTDKIQDALLNLVQGFDEATINGKDFLTVLQSLHGKSVAELKQIFIELGLSEEQAEENAKTLKAQVDSFSPQHVITVSEAFGNLAGGIMSCYSILNSVESIISSLSDEDLSAWEKFGAIISGIMVIGPNIAALGKSATAVGTFVKGLKGATSAAKGMAAASGTAAAGAEGVGAASGAAAAGGLSALATGLIAVAIAAVAIWAIVKVFNAIKEASPEGQLKKISAAAEEAKTAAEDAANAYDDLKNTIDSYDSCIKKLADLEVGTQAFRDALEAANEKAWDLIRTYNLVKGKSEDWYIGDKGEVVITDKGKEKATSQAYENKLSAQAVQRSLELAESKQKVAVARDNLPIGFTTDKGDLDADEIIKILTAGGKTLSQVKEDYAKLSYQDKQEYSLKLAEKLYGDKFNSRDANQIRTVENAVLMNLDDFQAYKEARDQYQSDLETSGGQNISEILASNQAYQNSAYKNEIYDQTLEAYTKTFDDSAKYFTGKTEEQIQSEFEQALGSNYNVNSKGEVFNADGSKNEYYSSLGEEEKKNIIISNNASKNADKAATDYVNSIETSINGLGDGAKNTLDSLTKGLDGFSEEAIQEMKDSGKELTREDLFGENFKLKDDSPLNSIIDGLIEQLNKQIKNYNPADFDLEGWQADYEQQLTAAGKISDKGIIKDADFEEFRPELQKFFTDLQNGTHVLTISTDEFNQKIRELSQQDLKEALDASAQAISQGTAAFNQDFGSKNVTADQISGFANQMLNSDDFSKYYNKADNGDIEGPGKLLSAMAQAAGIQDLASLGTVEEQVKGVAQAWLDLTTNFENGKTAQAASMGSIKELDDALRDGSISLKAYNEAFNAVLATEAAANNIDYSELENYTRILIKNNKQLEDNAQAAQKMALAYLKTEKGVKKISSSQDNWNKAIKNSKKDIVQYLKTVDEIKDAYKQVFNTIDPKIIEGLSDEFLTSAKTMSLMDKAISGSEQDWNNWEAAVLAEINNTSSAFVGMTQGMKDQMTELTTMAANLDFSGLVPGADIDDAPFLAKLNEMIFSTADAAQVMSDNLSSVGVDAEVQEYTYTVPPDQSSAIQTGNIVAFAPDGSHITVPISAEVQQADPGKTFKYYALKGAKYNGRGVRPAAATPVKSGGGGGGGKKSHADAKSFSDKDRYHTIKNQIEDLSAGYDDINKAKDRAFGKDRLKYMDQEIAKTDELIKAQKKYLSEIENYLPIDKEIMEKAYNEYIGGPGIEYDISGNISNFDEIQDAMFDKYNSMANAYTDDSDEWKIFEKKYELLEKYIEQYEETYDLLRDQKQELQDLINQKIDIGLEQVQYSVEVKLDIPDDKIKFLEYRLERIDDDAFKSIEAVTLLTKKADEVYKKIQINKEALNDVLKLSLSVGEITQLLAGDTSVLAGKSFTEEQINAIKEYRDNLLDLNSELDDVRETIEDKVMEAFDAWKEKVDAGISSIEHYGNILGSFRNIIDIVGKDTLGISNTFMNNLAQGTVDNAINKLEGTKKAYETIVKAREEASNKLAEAEARKDNASAKMWKDTLDQINEEIQSSSEEMMSAWEDALSGIAEQFENIMNDLIDTFNNSIYSPGGLDALGDDFQRQQDSADLLLDDYQKIYELSKLNRDVNKSINDIDSLSGKQKLKKLLEQINDLQEDGNEMSKYDLEYLQKTYDLRLAEIELEEAQRAKNTVRLQKDSEGNWSYIYTQSSDAIDSAQQKYEDALYAMQDLSSNYIDEMSDKLISTSKEMEDALAAIRIQDYASIDDYYAAVKKVQDQYQEQLENQQNELQKALDNNKQLYNEDWQNYHDATGYKISDLEDFATTFKDTMLGTLLGSESDTANFTDLIKDSVYNLTLGLEQAAETYYANLEKAMQAAGTSTSGFAEDATEGIQQVVNASQQGTEAVNDMADQMKTAFDEITESVGLWQENYSQNMEEIINSNLQVIKSFNDMLQALSIDPDSITVKYDIAKAAKDQDIDSYDTGGYTGNWGNSGKLAMLHSKELVLNANDTANMLTAVQITRAMLDTIDLNARQASFGLGNLVASGIKDEKDNTLKQEVSIVAQFPNVQDHNEIEEALSNLINHASQYANRR